MTLGQEVIVFFECSAQEERGYLVLQNPFLFQKLIIRQYKCNVKIQCTFFTDCSTFQTIMGAFLSCCAADLVIDYSDWLIDKMTKGLLNRLVVRLKASVLVVVLFADRAQVSFNLTFTRYKIII